MTDLAAAACCTVVVYGPRSVLVEVVYPGVWYRAGYG